ncbi:MAG: PIN domain-containing protein [Dehalococcoidia bacterium]
MTAFFIDTAAVIDVERRRPGHAAFIARVFSGDDEFFVCDIVVTEFYSGRERGSRPVIDKLLDSCTYVETTFAVARAAGAYRYSLARRGIQVSATDAIVAGAARSVGAILVTENVRDFPMHDLTVLTLAQATAHV